MRDDTGKPLVSGARTRPVRAIAKAVVALGLLTLASAVGTRQRPYASSWLIAGASVQGRSIRYRVIGTGDNVTLIIGGVHGDESRGVELVQRLAAALLHDSLPGPGNRAILLPCLNPDGLLAHTRTNAHATDINRNFPTLDWYRGKKGTRYSRGSSPASEPETQILMDLIELYQPDKVVSIHSPLRQVNYDGPAQNLARVMAAINGYPVTGTIGYPTPGSFGTWAGKERHVPVITLELPAVLSSRDWEEDESALRAAIAFGVPEALVVDDSLTIQIAKDVDSLYLLRQSRRLRGYSVSTGFNGLPYDGEFKVISKERLSNWRLVDDSWVCSANSGTTRELGPYFLALNVSHKTTKRRLGIHGTDREDLIGHRVSKGCVRMRNRDIEELYNIVPVGTAVRVR